MDTLPAIMLVATDGSEDADLAVRAAIDLSVRSGSELHVVHTWRRPTFWNCSLVEIAESFYTGRREEAERLLEEQAEQVRNAGGTLGGTHLREGRPAKEIARLAGELDTGLVVVGSRGLGPVKRLISGSVSEGVVHLAPCPTLVVRGGEGAWPPGRLILGDDGSEEAGRAGEVAAGIGKLFGARAFLMRVYPNVPVFKARRIFYVRSSEEVLEKGKRSLERRASELENVLGTRPRTIVVSGDAAAVIQEAAEVGGKPALVAVGRWGSGGVSTSVLRSVAGPVLISSTGDERDAVTTRRATIGVGRG